MSKFDLEKLREEVLGPHVSKLKVPKSVSGDADLQQADLERRTELLEQRSHPLKQHSLRGSSVHLETIAVQQAPLLDSVCLSGQLTVWYGPPNAGKTLIALQLLIDAVEQQRIDPNNVIYVDVDDNTFGLAQKVGILEQRNIHVLGEGHNGFTARKLIDRLKETIEQNKAQGLFIILDTLKKFVSLMHKTESSTFNALLREFNAAGGTVLALAHTNKKTGANGELIYAGTSDVREDFDAAYLLTPRGDDEFESDRAVVEFQNIKKRGDSEDRVLFGYDCKSDPKPSYDELLASVVRMDPRGFAPIQRQAEARLQEVIAAIEARITEGAIQKMDLAREIGARLGVGRQSVVRIINQFTGTDPTQHRWNYDVRERGAKIFRLLDRSPPIDAGD